MTNVPPVPLWAMHPACQTLPIYASHLSKGKKKYLYLGFLLISDFNFDLHFFDISSHIFFKNEDCISIFICNCSCIFIWILPCKPLCLPFVETSHYCISLYFDLDSCHAPCQTLPIYAFHLSKPAKSIAPVLIKQFPNPHYP